MKMPSIEDLERLKDAPVTALLVSGLDMLAILSTVQLALRHPGNVGSTADVVRFFGEELEKRIVAASPGMKDLCAAGWDPAYDG